MTKQKFKTLIKKAMPHAVRYIYNSIYRIIDTKRKKALISNLHLNKRIQPLFKNKRVLCWEPAPFPIHIDISSSLGVALSLRGCQVEQIVCDGTPVACIGREVLDKESFLNWPKRCRGCYRKCKYEASLFGVTTIPLGKLISSGVLKKLREIAKEVNIDKIPSFHYKGVNVGKYAISSLTRYYKGKIIEFEETLLREYLYSALVITEAAANKIESFKPNAIYMSHGIYSLWGPAMKIALQRGVTRYKDWEGDICPPLPISVR